MERVRLGRTVPMSLSRVRSSARLTSATSIGRVLLLHTNKPITVHSTCRTETVLLSLCGNLRYLQSLVRKNKGETVGHRSCAAFTESPAPQCVVRLR
ncbi:hypothetical protein AVEN_18201-1 [Araneus ventricosus]|uniref:Uncharacterized protein n=1 Tax=Araneus ventricosus TaxID=182803 RepID=A0A4Y2AK73_ARAVE|nr:hypothetical protein AVEN_18201-1 [Araneus ventricosus]